MKKWKIKNAISKKIKFVKKNGLLIDLWWAKGRLDASRFRQVKKHLQGDEFIGLLPKAVKGSFLKYEMKD